MGWWKNVFGKSKETERFEYYDEGVALMAEGKFHEALTSFRLALKESPSDPAVLQQIAMSYTRIGMTEEAAKTYRHVLQKDPNAAGAHYGLAFLLVRGGKEPDAIPHLRAFLENAPTEQETRKYVTHAREMLARLTGEGGPTSGAKGPQPRDDEFF